MLDGDHLGVLEGAKSSLVRVERRVDENVGVLELREGRVSKLPLRAEKKRDHLLILGQPGQDPPRLLPCPFQALCLRLVVAKVGLPDLGRRAGHNVVDRLLDLEARMDLADQQLEIRLPATESRNRALRDVGQLLAELGELGLEPVDGSFGRGVVEGDGVEGLVGKSGGERFGDGDAVADEDDMGDLVLDEDRCPFAENVPEDGLLRLALGGEAVRV